MRRSLRFCLPVIAALIIFTGCGNRPHFMKYEVVFYAPLGSGTNEIGNNLPLLTNNITNDTTFNIEEYLDVSSDIKIGKNRVLIADKYNRCVSLFPLSPAQPVNSPILSTGEGYSFGVPFQVTQNKYGEIYVVAAVSNYMELAGMRPVKTNWEDLQYDENGNVIENDDYPNSSIQNDKLYYIYKFSPDGKFIYEIGENGIHTTPMSYPERIDIDQFDNIYAYFRDFDGDHQNWIVKRYSPSGELTFEFNTRYLASTNAIDDKVYYSRVSDIYNLKSDERLMVYSESMIIKRKGQEVKTPDDFFISLDVYSILQNSITRNLYRSKKQMDQFLGVTRDDILVLYSYDDRFKGVRFRFIDSSQSVQTEEVYYAPMLSRHYNHIRYFIDDNGNIYSLLVKDNAYYVLLRWKKVKSRKIG